MNDWNRYPLEKMCRWKRGIENNSFTLVTEKSIINTEILLYSFNSSRILKWVNTQAGRSMKQQSSLTQVVVR